MGSFGFKDECKIIRCDRTYGIDSCVVVDVNGDVVFRAELPWSDDLIWKILGIGNTAYTRGYHSGQKDKIQEILTALDLRKTH